MSFFGDHSVYAIIKLSGMDDNGDGQIYKTDDLMYANRYSSPPVETAARPMITLAKGAIWASGNGSKTNAYTINMD